KRWHFRRRANSSSGCRSSTEFASRWHFPECATVTDVVGRQNFRNRVMLSNSCANNRSTLLFGFHLMHGRSAWSLSSSIVVLLFFVCKNFPHVQRPLIRSQSKKSRFVVSNPSFWQMNRSVVQFCANKTIDNVRHALSSK